VFFDSGDFFWPGIEALVGESGGVLSFRFGKCFEGVVKLLLKRGAGHGGKVITREGGAYMRIPTEDCSFRVPYPVKKACKVF
jgi:hypothetical protein